MVRYNNGKNVYSERIFKKYFIYLFERERKQSTSGVGGGEGRREGEADSLPNGEPYVGLDPRTLES